MLELTTANDFLTAVNCKPTNEVLVIKVCSEMLLPVVEKGDIFRFKPNFDANDSRLALVMIQDELHIGTCSYEGNQLKFIDSKNSKTLHFTDSESDDLPVIILGNIIGF